MATEGGKSTEAGARIRPLVLSHAADLFAERGPAATSLRDIAERSKVNAGLIFRHIGNKESVVAAVLDHLAEELEAARSTAEAPDDVEALAHRNWVVIARALLDGYDVGRLQQRFPNVEHLVSVARERLGDDHAARVATADALALQLGWRLFGPFLRAATGLEDSMPVSRDAGVLADHVADPRGDQRLRRSETASHPADTRK
ncbi:TetR/AcrR family transcriptional regulator [Mycolicibacterium sp. 018/SC-01/001]|uniref:TetR/AcrR family transcriptional regulator n=1 Tax=Mycolicibacterium sp. 018/SC-01/001 TaxID=2592069 RepID=UPI00117C4B9B|nr:TetR/AcrR family transcriptional regulator [Mycolicibacterium sp. 018/SC-01/001]TRW81803.1 TetR/AcrR family transcriptional regulator [Mycolicibacterium sp. 018/SC-01/001]